MNKLRTKGLLVSLVSVLVVVFGHNGYAAPRVGPQEFSADMENHAEGKTMKAKIYVGREKTRMEMPDSIMITRFDKNVSWMVMPSGKMYIEQVINRQMLPKTSSQVEGEIERVPLGKETVDGKQAEKIKVTYTENGSRTSMYQWLLDSGFPVKMEAFDGSWSVEYKNVSIGPQPPELFEPPAGYQKMSMPFAPGGEGFSAKDIMSQVEGAMP